MALVLSVSLWAVLSFLVPKSAWTAAELIRPVEDERTVYLRQKYARENLIRTHRGEMNQAFIDKNPHWDGRWPEKNIRDDLSAESAVAWAKYSDRIAKDLTTIAEDHHRKQQVQESLGKVLSRVSPAGSLRLLLTNVSGTGDQVKWRFLRAAWNYQNTVNDKVFAKKFLIMVTLGMATSGWPYNMGAETPPSSPLVMALPLGSVLTESALDIALLFLYAVLLFMLAYMLFLRRSIV